MFHNPHFSLNFSNLFIRKIFGMIFQYFLFKGFFFFSSRFSLKLSQFFLQNSLANFHEIYCKVHFSINFLCKFDFFLVKIGRSFFYCNLLISFFDNDFTCSHVISFFSFLGLFWHAREVFLIFWIGGNFYEQFLWGKLKKNNFRWINTILKVRFEPRFI